MNELIDSLEIELYSLDLEIRRIEARLTMWQTDMKSNFVKDKLITKEKDVLASLKGAFRAYSNALYRLSMQEGVT